MVLKIMARICICCLSIFTYQSNSQFQPYFERKKNLFKYIFLNKFKEKERKEGQMNTSTKFGCKSQLMPDIERAYNNKQ